MLRSLVIAECQSKNPAHIEATPHEIKESDSGQLMVCTRQLMEGVLAGIAGQAKHIKVDKQWSRSFICN